MLKQLYIHIGHFAKLCFFKDFLVFEIRKHLDLRNILVTPKIFLKSRVHCARYTFYGIAEEQKSLYLRLHKSLGHSVLISQ